VRDVRHEELLGGGVGRRLVAVADHLREDPEEAADFLDLVLARLVRLAVHRRQRHLRVLHAGVEEDRLEGVLQAGVALLKRLLDPLDWSVLSVASVESSPLGRAPFE
jgi:hypothetical protein